MNPVPFVYTTIVPKCAVPRCKAYASVIRSECSTIVLKIRYPESQYGLNASTQEWTTVSCDDHIDGYQIWIIGQGIVRKYPKNGLFVLFFVFFLLLPFFVFCFLKSFVFYARFFSHNALPLIKQTS